MNYLSNQNAEGVGQYSLMGNYGGTIGANGNGNSENSWSGENNFGHISLLGPSQRKPNAHRRERQLSSSFSGKFSSFYSTISMANEAMEDDQIQGTSIYSPSNSQVSSPVAYRTFSAPTSPTPGYFGNQQPQFAGPNVNENNFIDYDRPTTAIGRPNFYPNYSLDHANAQTNPVNDYFPFPYTPSNVEQLNNLNKYPVNESGSGYYFNCAPPEFNS